MVNVLQEYLYNIIPGYWCYNLQILRFSETLTFGNLQENFAPLEVLLNQFVDVLTDGRDWVIEPRS